MDISNLEKIIKYMTPKQRQKFLARMEALNLATDINKDPKFLQEAINEVSKEYPFVKEILKIE